MRERNIFPTDEHVMVMSDSEGKAVDRIVHDSSTFRERQVGQELCRWWIFPFKSVTF